MAMRLPAAVTGVLQDPRLRLLWPAVAGLLALLGVILIWNGYSSWQSVQRGELAVQARDRVNAEIAQLLQQSRTRLSDLLKDPETTAYLQAGAYEPAIMRLRGGWRELVGIRILPADLDEAYADPAAVGWGRMAVISAAAVNPEGAIGVVGQADELALGVAAPWGPENGTVLAIAFAELPIELLTAPVNGAEVGSGLLELRSGTHVLAARGDAGLRALAVPTVIKGTTLRLAAGAPAGEAGALAYAPPIGLGLVLWVLAGGLLVQVRASGRGTASTVETSFAEALAAAPAAPREEPKPKPAAPPKAPAAKIDRSIFRAYDIRGVVDFTLDEGVARVIGQAVGSTLQAKGLREIVVGRDGRHSGPALSAALIEGLRMTGCDVIDVGMVPTPVVYFATHQLNTGSGIAVTGSHNPPNYNGFKIMIGGETLSGNAIQALYTRIADNDLVLTGGGGLQSLDLGADYVNRIGSDVQLERPIRVVVDAGNGVAGVLAPQVLQAIGCEVEELFCDIDGDFPNHHPDPSNPANLRDLATAVKRTQAELGLAFDGDGDRLGVITRDGEVIYADRLLMLFASDVLARNPGATVIYDVKCTGHLAAQILRHGGSPIMWKTGHSLIKAKMKETDAELAGEMSGHFFFKERWYGFDDGIYAAARLLEIVAADGREPEEIFAELPKGASTPELKIEMVEGEHYAFCEAFAEKAKFEGAKIVTIDGVRADWADGWGLVRCSNTTPSLVLRFDADNEDALARIQAVFRAQLLAVDPSLKLPF